MRSAVLFLTLFSLPPSFWAFPKPVPRQSDGARIVAFVTNPSESEDEPKVASGNADDKAGQRDDKAAAELASQSPTLAAPDFLGDAGFAPLRPSPRQVESARRFLRSRRRLMTAMQAEIKRCSAERDRETDQDDADELDDLIENMLLNMDLFMSESNEAQKVLANAAALKAPADLAETAR